MYEAALEEGYCKCAEPKGGYGKPDASALQRKAVFQTRNTATGKLSGKLTRQVRYLELNRMTRDSPAVCGCERYFGDASSSPSGDVPSGGYNSAARECTYGLDNTLFPQKVSYCVISC